MTVSLFSTTLGEFDEFKRILAKAGFTAEEVRTMNGNPEAAVEALRRFRQSAYFHHVDGTYLPAEEQVRVIRALVGKTYFKPRQYEKALKCAPAWPQYPRQMLQLVPYLSDPTTTFRELSDFAGKCANVRIWREMYEMRFLCAGDSDPRDQLRWETIEFPEPCTGSLEARKDHYGGRRDMPHAAVLAAIGTHSGLLHKFRHEAAIEIWMPGYEAYDPPKKMTWVPVVYLHRDGTTEIKGNISACLGGGYVFPKLIDTVPVV